MVMRTLFACCLTPAVVCGAGGCVAAAGGVVVAVADVCGCGETAVSCFRRCVAATAGVLRCLDCVWQRQMCAVPAVVCTSGAVLRCGVVCGAGGCVAVPEAVYVVAAGIVAVVADVYGAGRG